MSAVDLGTDLAGLALDPPVMCASGCGGTGRELEATGDLAGLGAFTTRTITLDPRPGAAAPRLVETASGVLWETGGHNPGRAAFRAVALPALARRGVPTVVSGAGSTIGEYAELAGRLAGAPGVRGLEVNLVSRNADAYERRFCDDGFQVTKVLAAVRAELPAGVALWAKLAPGGTLPELARAAAVGGADAVVLVHGFAGITFDPDTWRPSLGGGPGLVGGPAVLSQALRCVWDVHAAVPTLPLIGCGGVRSGRDAVQMLLAGASAVQVGTWLLRDPSGARRIAVELAEELRRHDHTRPGDLVGLGHHDTPEGPR